MERGTKLRELAELEEKAERLRAELRATEPPPAYAPPGYYTSFHILAGIVLGFLGACSSLLFNVVGATLVGLHPLQLIRVYLTFPLGEKALATDDGFTLAMGCFLYVVTGKALGVPVHVVLSRWFARAGHARRLLVATGLGLVLWAFNFYAVLLWLQPLLFGGDWIVRMIPPWVAAATHLVFAWTVLGVDEFIGTFRPLGDRETEPQP